MMNRKETLELLKDIIDRMTNEEFKGLKDIILSSAERQLDEDIDQIIKNQILKWDKMERELKEDKLNKTIIAYVDGSFDKEKKLCGSGVVFLNNINDEKPITTINFPSEDEYNMRNIQGECEACIRAIEIAVLEGYSEIHIYHDYQGISSWAKKEWKAKNDYTKGYVKRFDELSKKINVKFVKVKGHSKDKWNDEADRLAKMSIGK
ncbi:RNase H family protein [Clostridium perfringens]|uniref:RNase H family protein n=1 Tax=Clostridium perfringens TaxID=1502 RepID=UPI0023412751|nr:RNase H family protein [Clostridium perfringens]MDC4245635.1 reverse transcriptase-like protein [Clostridium perfringens]